MHGRSRMTIWYRPSHSYNAGTEHVAFSPIRQTLLAPPWGVQLFSARRRVRNDTRDMRWSLYRIGIEHAYTGGRLAVVTRPMRVVPAIIFDKCGVRYALGQGLLC